jgi:hypothetical protein
MKTLKLLVLVASLFGAGAVHARPPVPVVNYENLKIATGSGKTLDPLTLRKAVMSAGLSRKWDVAPTSDANVMQASYTWNNNKHSILVNIELAPTELSITYANSLNMKYQLLDGQQVIHPHYNRFVSELVQSIRAELLRY